MPELKPMVASQDIKELVMDFGGVKTVDSMGLGVIVESCRL